MKATRRQILAATLFVAAAQARAAAPAPEPFTNFNVMLLQPSKVLEERVVSIDAMAEYIKAIESAAREAVAASPARQSTGGFLVVAIRPGLRSRVWLDFDTLLDLDIKKQLTSKVEAVPAFDVRKGPVVFALKVAVWGGKETRRAAPLPAEWKQASASHPPLEVGALVESIWVE